MANVGTSTVAYATQQPTGSLVFIASDGTACVLWNDGTNQKFSYASSPYSSWTTTTLVTGLNMALGGKFRSGSDNIDVVTGGSANVRGNYYPLTKIGATYSLGTSNVITGTTAIGTTAVGNVMSYAGQDPQGRHWIIVGGPSTYTAETGYFSPANSPTSTGWTASPSTAVAQTGDVNLPAGDQIGNFILRIWWNGTALQYSRADNSAATIGAWAAATTIPNLTGSPNASSRVVFKALSSTQALLAYSTSTGIYAQTYNPSTNTFSTATQLSTNASDRHPAIATDGAGNGWVFWCSFAAANSYALVFKKWNGTSWDSSVTTLVTSGTNIANPSAGYANGIVAAIYTQGTVNPFTVGFVTTTSSRTLACTAALAYDVWYDPNYHFKKQFVIDHTQVVGGANHSSFPVLVSLTHVDLATVANGGKVQNSSGFDLIFTDGRQTTKLDHEIQSYTATSGAIIAWVRVPTLSPITDTVIYIYYGNSAVSTSQENKTGVWDSNYKGVWHLEESGTGAAGEYKDSTSNANHGQGGGGTAGNVPVQGAGQIGKGQIFNGATSRRYIELGAPASLDLTTKFTISGWYKSAVTSNSGYAAIIAKGQWRYSLNLHGTNNLDAWINNTVEILNATALTTNWTLAQWTVDTTANQSLLFVNGVQVASATATAVTSAPTEVVEIGEIPLGSSTDTFNGTLDELRISSGIARSPGWNTTEYNNQVAPTTFGSLATIGQGERSIACSAALFQLARVMPSLACLTTVRYVSPTGNDTNSGLTTGTAWQTLVKAFTSASPGMTIEFADGNYQAYTYTTISGTADKPITYHSTNKWGARIIEPAGMDATKDLVALFGDYIVWDGFEVTTPNGRVGVTLGANFGWVKNCWIHDVCNLQDPGTTGGAAILEYTANFDLSGNQVTVNKIDRIGLTDGSGNVMPNAYIQGIYMNCNNPLADGLVANNIVSHVACSGLGGGHKASHWLWTNNTVFNCLSRGMDIWAASGAQNTTATDYNTVQNNLFMNAGPQYAIWSPSDSNGPHNVFRNNLAYGTYSGGTYNYVPEYNPSFTPLQTDTNRPDADPQLVNYQPDGSGDYHLKSTSPAIDTGTATLAPPFDYDGWPRPYGAGVDIGAFEYHAQSRTLVASVALGLTGTRIIPASTVLIQTRTRTATGTTALLGTFTRVMPTSAALAFTQSRTLGSSVALLSTSTRTVVSSAALLSTLSRSASMSVALLLVKTRTFGTSATLVQIGTRIVPAAVALQGQASRTVPTSAVLSITRIVPLSGALSLTSAHTLGASSALLLTQTRQASTSTALLAIITRSVPITSALIGQASRNILATGALSITRVIPTSAAFLLASSRVVPANSALLSMRIRTIGSSGALVGTFSRTGVSSAALLASFSRGIGTSAALIATRTRTMTTDTALSLTGTITRTIPVTGVLITTTSRSIGTSAALGLSNLTRMLPTSGALLSQVSRGVPLTSAFLQQANRGIGASTPLQVTGSRQVTTSLALVSQASRSIPASIALIATLTRTSGETAALIATLSRILSIDAALTLPGSHFRGIPCSTTLSGGSRVIPTSAALKGAQTSSIPCTASISLPIQGLQIGIPASTPLQSTSARFVVCMVALLASNATVRFRSGVADVRVRSGTATIIIK